MTTQDYNDIIKTFKENERKIRGSREEALKLIDSLGIRHIFDNAEPINKKTKKEQN